MECKVLGVVPRMGEGLLQPVLGISLRAGRLRVDYRTEYGRVQLSTSSPRLVSLRL